MSAAGSASAPRGLPNIAMIAATATRNTAGMVRIMIHRLRAPIDWAMPPGPGAAGCAAPEA